MEGLVLSDLARDLILNILNIIILFLIVRKLAYQPVKKFLAARQARVAKELEDAATAKAEAEQVKEQLDSLTQAQQEKADAVIREAEREARENAREIMENAQKDAAEIRRKAAEEAEKEKRKTIAGMQDDITALAFDISEKVLGREINDEDNRRIAQAFLADYHAE